MSLMGSTLVLAFDCERFCRMYCHPPESRMSRVSRLSQRTEPLLIPGPYLLFDLLGRQLTVVNASPSGYTTLPVIFYFPMYHRPTLIYFAVNSASSLGSFIFYVFLLFSPLVLGVLQEYWLCACDLNLFCPLSQIDFMPITYAPASGRSIKH